MKLTNLPVDVSYGDKDPAPKKEYQTENDEAHESEEASEDQKRHAKSVLGFDPAELFKEAK